MAKYAAERDFHSFIIPSLSSCPTPEEILPSIKPSPAGEGGSLWLTNEALS